MNHANKLKEAKDLKSLLATLQENNGAFAEFIIIMLLKMDKDSKLKYTEEELESIEEKINEMFPEGHQPLPTTLIPFGFYLGEYLRRRIPGAEWEITDEVNEKNNVWEIDISFKSAEGYIMKAKPFRRASKFWDRREDKMSSFVKMIELTSEVQMDKEYWSKRADDDGWIEIANEMMFRMFIGDEKSKKDFSDAKGAFHDGKFGDGKYGKSK